MAEHVQETLDNMVAPLRDLLDRGIFTELEIQAIVARRRESEYLLRRRSARKADFLRYIESEIALERLRQLRSKKAHLRKDREEKVSGKIGPRKKVGGLPIGDVHIVQWIHVLFARMLRKFRSDVSLYLQHAAVAREFKSYHKLKIIYAEALQIHPRKVGLWIEAASHEFFGYIEGASTSGKVHGGGNIQSARILMQRGLRVNPKAQELWIQYFTLELHFLQKLKGRQQILQIPNINQKQIVLNEANPIIRVIYENAIKTVPDSVPFRLKFLEQCLLFPDTDSMVKLIVNSIDRDFSGKPEAWIARAHFEKLTLEVYNIKQKNDRGLKGDEIMKEILKILDQSLQSIPTGSMKLMITQFIRQNSHILNDAGVGKFLDRMYDSLRFDEQHFSQLILERSNYLYEKGKIDEAIQYLRDSVKSSDDVEVQRQLAWLFKEANNLPAALDLLQKCLKLTPIHDSRYKVILLDIFGAMIINKESFHVLEGTFEQLLLLSCNIPSDELKPRFGINTLGQACKELLNECERQSEIRKITEMVLERSTYCESARGKSETELESMANFFDEAMDRLQVDTKKDFLFCRRLCEKAIKFFSGYAPEVADSYRARKDDFSIP
jgi:tetratricopeptide (TPR) repeat protein